MSLIKDKVIIKSLVDFGSVKTGEIHNAFKDSDTEGVWVGPNYLSRCEFDYWKYTPEKIEKNDPVNNPKHYTNHPSVIECIQVSEHMGFNLGNALKYIWRCSRIITNRNITVLHIFCYRWLVS